MSKPGRVLLMFATIGILALMGMMMKRVLDFQSQIASDDLQELEVARIPLPAGPRRFQ